MAAKRDQPADAQDLYDDRSVKYDESHHPRFAKHMAKLADIQQGEHVLDLACGTGLLSYYASSAVGVSGSVIGVDISTGMLAQAEAKKSKHSPQNVSFYKHSITELDSLDALEGKQFDLISCCSALVLLEHPDQALQQWFNHLKPGGRLIVDVTHPNNLISGLVFERSAENLQSVMENAGLHSIDIKLLSQLDTEGTDDLEDYIRHSVSDAKVQEEYSVDDADRIFDEVIDTDPMKSLATPPEVREKARALFKDEWAKVANAAGKVEKIDGVYVGIGWKQQKQQS